MVALDTLFDEQTPGEIGLLFTFIVVSVYMFVEAGNYREVIGLYPRLLSGVVLVCAVLLLFRNLLPAPLSEWVGESGSALGSSAAVADRSDEEEQELSMDVVDSDTGTSREQVILTVLVGGYLLLSYLVGMYLATPVFVLVYGMAFGLGWKATGGLTALAWAFAHVFLVVFNAPIASGTLL